jgi:hypothetical protein
MTQDMTQETWGEVLAIIGVANETNKLALAPQVSIYPTLAGVIKVASLQDNARNRPHRPLGCSDPGA